MKVALLSILLLFQTWAFAQDCADCAPKSLPTPLEGVAKEGLAIAEKLQKPTKKYVICLGRAECQFFGSKASIKANVENYNKAIISGYFKIDAIKAEALAVDEMAKAFKDKNGESDPKYLAITSVLKDYENEKNELIENIPGYKQTIKSLEGQLSGESGAKYCSEDGSDYPAVPKKCGLQPEEYEMISFYSGSGYGCLNAYLRSEEKIPKIDEIVKVTDEGLSKLPSYQGFVRRGATLPEEVRNSHKAGATITYKSFTSTSTSYGFGGSDIFYIFSKTGKPIMDISNYKGEYEILFRSNTKFKVLSVEKVDNVNYYVMKEVTSDNKAKEETEDKEILEKVKSAPALGVDSYSSTEESDKFACPINAEEKIPASFEQKKMPVFKQGKP